MPEPRGTLTPAQHQILQAIWHAGPQGATVTEIWQEIADDRSVTRTTVLNQVDRLEKRGWLRRAQSGSAIHYLATMDSQTVRARLAAEFADEYFNGSASKLLMSLIDTRDVREADLDRLEKLLDEARRRKKGGRPWKP